MGIFDVIAQRVVNSTKYAMNHELIMNKVRREAKYAVAEAAGQEKVRHNVKVQELGKQVEVLRRALQFQYLRDKGVVQFDGRFNDYKIKSYDTPYGVYAYPSNEAR